MADKIDIVVTWVDGTDPKWLAEKKQYVSNSDWSEADDAMRYRPSENFKYWFRGIEKYASWVNKVFFITYGHVPDWLDTTHPKLRIIKHADYIPKEYLPTYNSHVIELNLHRIAELSEHFILFSDDVYVVDKTRPEDFFYGGLPLDYGIYKPITPREGFNHIELNNTIVMNRHFNKRSKSLSQWKKFYNLRLRKYLIDNLISLPYEGILGYKNFHITLSHLKSTFETVWSKENELLQTVSSNRFRTLGDVNHFLMSHWNVELGKFEPQSIHFGKYFEISEINEIAKQLQKRKYKVICINDVDVEGKFAEYDNQLKSAFQKLFPEKSSFEK